MILAVSRAIGETAPLLLVGATVFVTFNPEPFSPDGYSALPVQIFQYATRSQEEFKALAAAGIIVMLVRARRHELVRDLAPQPLRAKVVGDLQLSNPMTQDPASREGTTDAGPAAGPPATPTSRFARRSSSDGNLSKEEVFELKDISVFYGDNLAVQDITMDIYKRQVTALIGPSGCGKSHADPLPQPDERPDPDARRSTGQALYHGEDLYGPKVDPVQVRKLIGMVFQKPNPFPKSIYDNIAFGPQRARA